MVTKSYKKTHGMFLLTYVDMTIRTSVMTCSIFYSVHAGPFRGPTILNKMNREIKGCMSRMTEQPFTKSL